MSHNIREFVFTGLAWLTFGIAALINIIAAKPQTERAVAYQILYLVLACFFMIASMRYR